MFINELEAAIDTAESSRDKASPIRLSNTGKCPMATYLKMCGFPQKPLGARVIMMFRTGDLSEQAFKNLAKEHLEGKSWQKFIFGTESTVVIDEEPTTIYRQIKVNLKWENFDIEGHLDGIGLKTWNDPYVIEFKTMSNFGFKRFEGRIIDTDYLWQTQAYMAATGINKALIVSQRKETGHMAEQIIDRDTKYDCKARWGEILKATPTNLPRREGSFSGDPGALTVNYPCSYCSFYEICYKDTKIDFVKGKPVIHANTVREPKEISELIIGQSKNEKNKIIKLKGDKDESKD